MSSSPALATRLVAATSNSSKSEAEVCFGDGAKFRLHALWLRDSCRDDAHVEAQTERVLSASPLVTRLPLSVGIKEMSLGDDGRTLTVEWDEGNVARSHFDAGFLRALAPAAGKQIGGPAPPEPTQVGSWFEFLNGKGDHDCPTAADLQLWDASNPKISRFDYADLAAGRVQRDEFLRAIIDPGATIVSGMPDDPLLDGTALAEFAAEYLGGLQKHPRRDAAHWTISTNEDVGNSNMIKEVKKVGGATNAYDTNKQLCNHTDQSLYGTPGLLLAFHCAHGEGNNSLTDGYAVAYALKERYPEQFELLTKYGMNAGRNLKYYTTGPLLFDTTHPVLQVDRNGSLARVQYHESYRTPSTVPFEVFPQYMQALNTFYAMVHDPEFQTHMTLTQGECLIMNNWRTMHGRAGLAGKIRTIIGGTVTREAFYSAVREAACGEANVAAGKEVGVPSAGLHFINPVLAEASTLDLTQGMAAVRIKEEGYGVIRLGENATLEQMEQVARPLLGLSSEDTANRYNGAGGVTRPTLGESMWLDAGMGAPAELRIQFHNEMAYANRFPKAVAFAMKKQAENDGATLLVDNVEVTKLLSPTLRRKMASGVRYTRILHPEAASGDADFYTSWQGAFQTADVVTAFERVSADGGALEALSDKKRFRHTMWGPVFYTHPTYGEIYFSSILNRHGSWLDGHAVFGQMPLQERPYHCLWANGAELAPGELDELRGVHEQCTKEVMLAEGDVLVLDNLRIAHGRTPWQGGSRQMGLLLSELVPREVHRTPPEEYTAWLQTAAQRMAQGKTQAN